MGVSCLTERMPRANVSALVLEAQESGKILGVRLPIDDDELEEPWLLAPSRRSEPRPISATLPASVDVTLADGIFVDRTDLLPEMIARLVRLAAFQNPEFYRAQAMRMPTYGKPRIVSCAQLHPRHVALPRGCLDEAIDLLRFNRIRAIIKDRRELGTPLDLHFLGTLKPDQQRALRP